jgi:hypothetical protein
MFSRHRLSDHGEPPPLSDEQAMAQVVEPAREIVRAAELRDVTGGFMFESHNDQGRPPFRGRVDMSFALPDEVEPHTYYRQIATTMADQGWTDGPPAGKQPFGVVIHTESVMAIIGAGCGATSRGSIQVCGQFRNMTDHRDDGKTVGTAITDQLR